MIRRFRTEIVPTHKRISKKGRVHTVPRYKRKAKPKIVRRVHRSDAYRIEVIPYRDDQGRIVGRRIVRKI